MAFDIVPGPKGPIIEEILTNSTYMPDSGMVCQLRKSLSHMSKADLMNLNLIITFKKSDSVDLARTVDKIMAKSKTK